MLRGAALLRRPLHYTDGPLGWDSMGAAAWIWHINQYGIPDRVALEYPQIYSVGKGKGDPNDLFPVACVAQSVAVRALGHSGNLAHYLPREWKGTRNKLSNTADVRKRLAEGEFNRIEIPSSTCEHCASQFPEETCTRARDNREPCLVHNIYDAIGIGLKALGRFERKRVIPR